MIISSQGNAALSKTPAIHFVQFDLFVSMTPREAENFMVRGAKGETFDFEDGKHQIIKKPRHVKKDRDSGEYYTLHGNNLYCMPCDWQEADWKFYLEHLRDNYGEHLA